MLQIRTIIVFGNIFLHQTLTECVANQYTHFDVLICQMELQVMERLLIVLLHFLGIFQITEDDSCLKGLIFTKLSQIWPQVL